MKEDIHWIQRFNNYRRAFSQLQYAMELMRERELSILEKQGVIQAFEYNHELAWKTLKDFLESRGHREIYGSRDAIREAFSLELIDDGDIWMEMIKSRNLTSHTYDEGTADEIIALIRDFYYREFQRFKVRMEKLEREEEKRI